MKGRLPFGHEWMQKFDAYSEAFLQLEARVELAVQRELSIEEKSELSTLFFKTRDLAGEAVIGFFTAEGDVGLHCNVDAFRLAFRRGLVKHGAALVKSCQTFDCKSKDELRAKLCLDITNSYYEAFKELHIVLAERKQMFKRDYNLE